jgi:tetratricopeptide (TPR) repeat protein
MQRTLSSLPLLVAVPLLLPATGCQAPATESDVDWLVRHGRFAEAVELAEQDAAAAPGDAGAAERLRLARTAYVLDQGRQTLFAGDLDRALEILGVAESLAPENEVVAAWVAKVRAQLADRWLDEAQGLTASGEFDAALEAYEEALIYAPDDVGAKLGASRILLRLNYHMGLRESYYRDGLRAFRELELPIAQNSFEKAEKYSPSDAEVIARREEVEALLARERLTKARDLEQQGLWAAARNEYRLVLLVDAGSQEAIDGRDRMDREVRAHRKLVEGDMQIRKGDLERAADLLDQGEALSEGQLGDIGQARADLEQVRYHEMYEAALANELDDRFVEAIAGLEALIAEAGFYEDAIARKETLEGFVELAQRLYGEAAAADDEEAEGDLLRQIWIFWRGYEDVEPRLKALAAKQVALADQAATKAEQRAHLERSLELWPEAPAIVERLEALDDDA